MNSKIVLKNLGIILICEALLMLLSLAVAVIYQGGDAPAFIYTIVITLATGLALNLIKPDHSSLYAKEGIAIVSLGWVLISLFGALPFYFSGAIPNIIDCFFETVSGFTTTGATVLSDIESLPKGLLFWRSFTQWIGGLGILVFYLAILPRASASSLQIMKAESSGPTTEKLVPKTGKMAKILYTMYFTMTLVVTVLLMLGDMSLYDSLLHAFSTAGTGGFSNRNLSVAFYDSVYINIVIGIFMLVFGTNFALYYQMLQGNSKALLKDNEFRLYMGIVAVAVILITLNIYKSQYDSFGESLLQAFFQVGSIITTSGFSTADYNSWPVFSKMILLFLMFIGGCAGSTAGAIKNIRLLLILKVIKRELLRILHPKAVYSVKVRGKVVEDSTLLSVAIFFCIYMFIFAVSVLALALEGHNFEIAISSAAASIGNVGPGFGEVGPLGNYSLLSNATTLLLALDMLLGRLEIFPILMLLVPSFWEKVSM